MKNLIQSEDVPFIEQEVLLRIAEGDEQAFKILFYKFLPLLKPFVTRFTKSAIAAEEIIQDVFLRVWLNRDKLKTVSNIRSWIFRYTSNECLNYLRSELQNNKAIGVLSLNYPKESDITADRVKLNEINKLINEAVETLPAQRKKIYLLSRGEGLTIPDIAEKLNLSQNTVKNTLVISLKVIREYLAFHGYSFSLLFLFFLKK